ncbi:hypothetical protein [Hyphomonas sp.]|uniref:hypothetical protein n=1 Tax=Hyphomonas sp. TaxID=87 RepID=UPI00333F3E28
MSRAVLCDVPLLMRGSYLRSPGAAGFRRGRSAEPWPTWWMLRTTGTCQAA